MISTANNPEPLKESLRRHLAEGARKYFGEVEQVKAEMEKRLGIKFPTSRSRMGTLVRNKVFVICKDLFNFCLRHKTTILLVFIVVGSFYWFQWEPNHIRSTCASSALKLNTLDAHRFDKKGFDATYSLCLHEHGL